MSGTQSLSFAAVNDSGVAASGYTLTNAPNGVTLDARTGLMTIVPQSNGVLTPTVVAWYPDGSKDVLTPRLTVSGYVPADDPVYNKLKAIEDLLVYYCQVNPATTQSLARSGQAFNAIIQYMIDNPVSLVFDEVNDFMTLYATSIFDEHKFFTTLDAITNATDNNRAEVVYTAFRNRTVTPTMAFDYTKVFVVTGCEPLVLYLQSPVGTQPGFTQPTQHGAGDYTNISSTTINASTATVQLGRGAYKFAIAQATQITFIRDPDLSFPSTNPFFAESIVELNNTSGFSTRITNAFTKNAQQQYFELTGNKVISGTTTEMFVSTSTSTAVVLHVSSYDSGSTWVVSDIDYLN